MSREEEMTNGGGELGEDAVVDLPLDLESTPRCVLAGAEEEKVAASGVQGEGVSEATLDQTSAHEVLNTQMGDDSVKSVNEESPVGSAPLVDPEASHPEDTSSVSVAADVSEEVSNGPVEVGSAKVEVADGWNNGLPNGKTSGWTSADPPGEERSSASAEDAVSTAGVLGSGPAAVAPAPEQLPLQRYTYYMIRIPRPLDDKGKADITSAELKLQAKADERDQHNVHVQAAKNKRIEALEKRGAAREVEAQCLRMLRAKFEELKPLRDALRKIKDEDRSMNHGVPRTEEDLNYRIASLEWRIQHESIPLKEEKQLLREIKSLEASRGSLRQKAALNAPVGESLGTREEIEDALKPLNAEYKQLDSEYKAAKLLRESADEEFERQNEALSSVMGQWHKANDSRQEAYEARRFLKQQEYGRLRDFYDNKREIQQARDIASRPKSRKAVEDYCSSQLERVLGLWVTNDEFRSSYVKDNERSTVRRLETLDGRALGPDESPPKLSITEPPVSATVPERPSRAPPAENGHHVEPAVVSVAEPAAKAVQAPPAVKEAKDLRRSIPSDAAVSPPAVERSLEELEREAAELKEKRRAAEMAKAREADERKKRLAERAQLKAQAWAQKEAERKEKEREKRALKKAAAASSPEAPKSSESGLEAESNGSGPDAGEAVVGPKKVSSKQRRRGVTSSEKAARAAERIPLSLPSARHGRRKLLGLSAASWSALGAVVVVLVALAILTLYNGRSGQRAQSA